MKEKILIDCIKGIIGAQKNVKTKSLASYITRKVENGSLFYMKFNGSWLTTNKNVLILIKLENE